MNEKYTKVEFTANVKPIKVLNDEFSLVKIYCQGVGKNRNGTYMSKENIQKYLPTLNYCPVVGHIREYVDSDGVTHRYMGSHDYEIDWDTWEFKDLTVPYGVVVADSFNFETVNEYGKDVEYLTAQAILWTGRYAELNECIYADDFWFNQSMEILVGQYRQLEEDSNYTELLDWSYSALCLLGKADSDSTNGHTDKAEHSEPCFISAKVIPLEFSKSEFVAAMQEMKEKISFCFNDQSSVLEVDIDKELGGKDDMTDEENIVIVDEPTEEVVVEETTVEPESEIEPEVTEPEVTPDVSTVDVDEYARLQEAYAILEAEFEEYKANHSNSNDDYEVMHQFVVEAERVKREQEETNLFAKFEASIGQTDEFIKLKENSANFTIEELNKECLCIRGMYATDVNVAVQPEASIKFSVEKPTENESEPYGGLIKKYLGR